MRYDEPRLVPLIKLFAWGESGGCWLRAWMSVCLLLQVINTHSSKHIGGVCLLLQ